MAAPSRAQRGSKIFRGFFWGESRGSHDRPSTGVRRGAGERAGDFFMLLYSLDLVGLGLGRRPVSAGDRPRPAASASTPPNPRLVRATEDPLRPRGLGFDWRPRPRLAASPPPAPRPGPEVQVNFPPEAWPGLHGKVPNYQKNDPNLGSRIAIKPQSNHPEDCRRLHRRSNLPPNLPKLGPQRSSEVCRRLR